MCIYCSNYTTKKELLSFINIYRCKVTVNVRILLAWEWLLTDWNSWYWRIVFVWGSVTSDVMIDVTYLRGNLPNTGAWLVVPSSGRNVKLKPEYRGINSTLLYHLWKLVNAFHLNTILLYVFILGSHTSICASGFSDDILYFCLCRWTGTTVRKNYSTILKKRKPSSLLKSFQTENTGAFEQYLNVI